VCGIHCSEEKTAIKLKKLIGILVSACLLTSATGITAFASSDSGAPEIRVYDKNEALAQTANERILLDTWTISISPDGSVNENSNRENQVTFRKIN